MSKGWLDNLGAQIDRLTGFEGTLGVRFLGNDEDLLADHRAVVTHAVHCHCYRSYCWLQLD